MKPWKLIAIVLFLLAARSGEASSAAFTNLYLFSGGSDGATPYAGLVQGSDGNFYGTTWAGGTKNFGTVFRMCPSGSFTNLHTFSYSDGASPYAGLVQGSDGNFYGTAVNGGTNSLGTVFRICPSGSLTNLYTFSGSDGGRPTAALVQGSDGNFYGTTYGGGASTNCSDGCGTVFRISPNGSLTNLYSFSVSDGGKPWAGLVQGGDGNFYGTTYAGGNTNFIGGYGTVFRISPNGSLTNLHSFSGSDGRYLYAGLVLGSDGNFYGTTYEGGNTNLNGGYGYGTVFRISASGSLTSLHSFSGGSDGALPEAGLVQGSDGNFYGTTSEGGVSDHGTVFKVSVSLNPPANQVSAIQFVDTNVVLTIPSVAGETYQLQFSDSLTAGSWSNVDGAAVTNSIGALMTLTNFGGALQPQRFYRFSITP